MQLRGALTAALIALVRAHLASTALITPLALAGLLSSAKGEAANKASVVQSELNLRRLSNGQILFYPRYGAPMSVSGLPEIKSFSVAKHKSIYSILALGKDGDLWWVRGEDQNPKPDPEPETLEVWKLSNPVKLSSLTDILSVSTSNLFRYPIGSKITPPSPLDGTFFAAVRKDGQVWLWGDDTYGGVSGESVDYSPKSDTSQNRVKRRVIEKPRLIRFPRRIVDVQLGPRRSLALDEDGAVWSWGAPLINHDTKHDPRGPGEKFQIANNFKAVRVAGLPHIKKLTYPSRGDSCVIASLDGRVWCWGFRDSRGSIDGKEIWFGTASPTPLIGVDNVKEVRNDFLLTQVGDVYVRMLPFRDFGPQFWFGRTSPQYEAFFGKNGSRPQTNLMAGEGPDCFAGLCAAPMRLTRIHLGAIYLRIQSLGEVSSIDVSCPWILMDGHCADQIGDKIQIVD